MDEKIDADLKKLCAGQPQHKLGRSLWPEVSAKLADRRAPAVWPLWAAAVAGAAAMLVLGIRLRPRPEPGPQAGYYQEAQSQGLDLYGDCGRRGLPEEGS